MHGPLHDDELPIDVDTVSSLIERQFPEYAALPLRRLGASGSTNALFRLGEDLLVRLPRQSGSSAAIDKEHRWLPEIGPYLPVAVPEILALGQPDAGFSERWSIVRWIDGELPKVRGPDDPPVAGRSTLAADLADVILALRDIDVPASAARDGTLRWYRGMPLARFDAATRRNIEKCRSIEGFDIDLDAVQQVWEAALTLPGALEAGADRWFHSDLVAENLLLTDGRLSAVLDFGGLAIGDPTIDLHGAWELFDTPARDVFRERLGVDDAEWFRGRAWALAIALGCFTYYWDTLPTRCQDRLAMTRSVLEDAIENRP